LLITEGHGPRNPCVVCDCRFAREAEAGDSHSPLVVPEVAT